MRGWNCRGMFWKVSGEIDSAASCGRPCPSSGWLQELLLPLGLGPSGVAPLCVICRETSAGAGPPMSHIRAPGSDPSASSGLQLPVQVRGFLPSTREEARMEFPDTLLGPGRCRRVQREPTDGSSLCLPLKCMKKPISQSAAQQSSAQFSLTRMNHAPPPFLIQSPQSWGWVCPSLSRDKAGHRHCP